MSKIAHLAHELLASLEPVSFYDTYALVCLARERQGLDEDELRALITVFDHEHTTRGGKKTLGDFLRTYAQRRDRERARGRRIITPRDHGKIVRARAGERLLLALNPPGNSASWSATSASGPISLAPLSPAERARLGADYALVLLTAGSAALTLSPPAHLGGRRACSIQIVIEPPA